MLKAKLMETRPSRTISFEDNNRETTGFVEKPTKQWEARTYPEILSILSFQVPTVERAAPNSNHSDTTDT